MGITVGEQISRILVSILEIFEFILEVITNFVKTLWYSHDI